MQLRRNQHCKKLNMSNSNTCTTIAEILRCAEKEDIDVLVDYITDSGKGRLALEKEVCATLTNAKRTTYGQAELTLIERELRQFGGNTVANLLRSMRGGIGSMLGHGTSPVSISYDEIVRDVAEHLKVDFSKQANTPEVEEGILRSLLVASFEKMSALEREAILNDLGVANAADLVKRGASAISAGLAAAMLGPAVAYRLSGMVAAASVQALLGRGLVIGASSFVARPLVVLAGPIGWAVTGAWALADMASPAYRVTVPCVVQVAYMRRKASGQHLLNTPHQQF